MSLGSRSRFARAAIVRLACLSALVACLLASVARADEASGTWTGQIEGRGNYYWEPSTRVVMPTAKLSVEAPNGVRMNAAYLVDVISSASIAQGANTDGVGNELRHAVGVGAGKKFAIGDNDLDLSVRGIFSTESDYISRIVGGYGSYTFNDKDTTLSLGVTGVLDTIYANNQPTFEKHLKGLTTGLGFAQVLSPVLILAVGYQFVTLDGFLGNAYRKALIGPLPHAEAPPTTRLRHNAEAQLSWYLPASLTTLQLYGRLYIDSWSQAALTPELRVYQQLTSSLVGRLRFRFYDQTRADFALKAGETRYPVGYTGPITSDPKMSAFHSEQIGVRLELALAALGGTFLDFAKAAILDLSFDYQWTTSTYGNNVQGTAGGRLPF